MGFLQTTAFYFKTVVAVGVFFGCAVYGTLASVVLTLVGKQHLAQWATARAFYHTFSRILNIKIVVHNEAKLLENLPGILIGNHQSTLDILVLGRIFPQGCTVTAKRSLQYIPFLGWFMSLSGTFFLDRANRDKSIVTLNRALTNLKKSKRSLWMFPEGTRSYSKELYLGPFKKGAFHLAVDAQLPLLPVVVSNTSNIINFKEKVFNAGTIVIECLEPVSTVGLKKEDVNKLTLDTREAMLAQIDKLGYSKVANGAASPVIVASAETDGEPIAITSESSKLDPELTETTSLLENPN